MARQHPRVHKLVLYPQPAAGQNLSEQPILDVLLASDFLDGRILEVDGEPRYLLGEACLTELTFLGCSPHIELDPPRQETEQAAREGRFCHLTLQSYTQPVWRIDPTARPRCPGCRQPMPAPARVGSDTLACPACGEANPAADWRWRNLAGRACLFVDIWGVFTAEAVPNRSLIDRLESATGVKWAYFYVKD